MTAARRAHGARNESLQSAAVRHYDEAGRNSSAAVDLLIASIRKRPALHEEAYRIAAETVIGMLNRSDRASVMRGKDIGSLNVAEADNDHAPTFKSSFTPQSAASVAASTAAFRRFTTKLTGLYLTKFKYNGEEFQLGLATPEQLRPVAQHYLGQGATMVRTARWLERIIASSKDGQPIHRSLALKEIERLKSESFSSSV